MTTETKEFTTYAESGDAASELGYNRGWDRLNDSDSLGTISYDNSTKTFTIAVKSGQSSFSFWCGGKKFTKTSSESVALLHASSGTYYIYYDTDGALQVIVHSSVTQAAFMNCITGMYYYDATNDELYPAKDEQHGVALEPMAHYNMHVQHGFSWPHSGSEIEGLSDGGDTFTQITAGTFLDEDIEDTRSALTTLPFGYKIGSDGHWEFTTAGNDIGYIESGNTYVSYNDESGGTWSLVESTTATDYIIYIIVRTNLEDIPAFIAVGQQWYDSRAHARDGLENALHALNLSGLPGAEICHCFAYICKRDATLEDSGATAMTHVDLRATNLA